MRQPRPAANDAASGAPLFLTAKQVREQLYVSSLDRHKVPKIAHGRYDPKVIELIKKVRAQARVGWSPAIRVATAILEGRLP